MWHVTWMPAGMRGQYPDCWPARVAISYGEGGVTADGFGNCRLLGLRSAAASWRALQLGCFFMFPGLLFDRFISELCSIIRSCIKWSVFGSQATSCMCRLHFSVVQWMLRVTKRRKSSKKVKMSFEELMSRGGECVVAASDEGEQEETRRSVVSASSGGYIQTWRDCWLSKCTKQDHTVEGSPVRATLDQLINPDAFDIHQGLQIV